MAILTKSEIMDFSPINKGEKEDVPAYKRTASNDILKAMDSRLIIAITGLRRVGKTTLIKQILDKNSFYFSFDEKRYANPDALKQVIETFVKEGEKPIIALDEIFRVEDWAGVVKRYHDQKLARFIVSGSSALGVKKGVESLAGRMVERYIQPLQFDEYLALKGIESEPVNLGNMFKKAKRQEAELASFLVKGSFPELAAVSAEKIDCTEYIKTSTIERIIFDDIPATFRIENPSKLYDLFRLCTTNSSKLFTEVNLAEALQMNRYAVSDYLLYLQKSYLLGVIYPKGSAQKAYKKQKKIFAKTASIYNAIAENPNVGQAAETAVFDRITALKPAFYRDAQKREVDFITSSPIEVKFQSTILSSDLDNLIYYAKKKRAGKAIVVTKNTFDEKEHGGVTVTYIPLDVFLQMQI
jgi:predicted AAA+ superfamily ATPase